MTTKEKNNALYEIMCAEQATFREQLKSLPPEEIISHAYEDVCCKGEFQNP